MFNRWKSAVRYVELIEGWIIDTGAGYIAIRKADGKSAYDPQYIGAYADMWDFLKSEEE